MKEKELRKGFLKEKFEGYHVEPPESVWTGISNRLGGSDRRGLVIVILSAAATIALAVTLGINYFGNRVPGQEEFSEMPEAAQESLQIPQEAIPEETPRAAFQDKTTQAEAREATPGDERAEYQQQVSDDVRERYAGSDQERARQQGLEEKVEGILDEMEHRVDLAVREDETIQGELPVQEEVAVQGELPVQEEAVVQGENTVQEEVARTEGQGAEVRPGIAEGQGMEATTDLGVGQDEEVTQNAAEIPLEDEQLTGISEEEKARWIIGAALSPLYSFRDAEAGAIGNAGDVESGMMAYAAGVQVSFRAAKRLAIESGVFFNKMGISIGASGIRMFDSSLEATPMDGAAGRSDWVAVTNSIGNIIASSGDIYVNNYKLNAVSQSDGFYEMSNQPAVVSEEGIRQHLDYLELPLNLRYSVVDRTFELQLVGGMSANFLLNNYITMDTPSGNQEIGYLANIRNVNYSGNAGLGMVYHVHSQISLRLEPRFRYFLNSVNDATLPATRPYSLGLYTGFTYTF